MYSKTIIHVKINLESLAAHRRRTPTYTTCNQSIKTTDRDRTRWLPVGNGAIRKIVISTAAQ